MTRIFFHVLPTRAPAARLRYLIHLLTHDLSGQTVDLRLPDDEAAIKLDQQLWRHPPEGFLPHAPGWERPDAPVRLWGARPPDSGHILINLHPDFLNGFTGYNQIIELLDQSDALLERGRERYRQYRQADITPEVIKPEERPS